MAELLPSALARLIRGKSAVRIDVVITALVIAQFAGIIMKKMLSHVRLVHPEVSSSISAYDNAFLIFMLPQSFITTSILTAGELSDDQCGEGPHRDTRGSSQTVAADSPARTPPEPAAMQRDDEEQALDDDAQGRRSGQYPHHLRGPGSGVRMGSELHQEPHQSGNLNDTIFFGFICMPQIFFYGLYAILGQVLNARNQFAAFMWSPHSMRNRDPRAMARPTSPQW
jgi:hypothetical protein